MDYALIAVIILSFAVTLLIVPNWIKRAEKAELVGKDVHKKSKEDIAEAGGITVILGFVIGILGYIAIKTFYFKTSDNLIEIFALLSTILLICFIGMIDDILGWKIGLSKRTRIILVLFSAIPLMAIDAGNHEMLIPFFGVIYLGVIYTLVMIPIGILGASTTFNMLAGYNGLEAGQGILIISALSAMSWITGNEWLGVIGLCMVASLIAFWKYNKYPAKVFPGDVLTYPVGALIAIMAILGNYEMFAAIIFIPYIIEVILKLRGGLKKESFGELQEDGSIKNKYDKVYGLEHVAIRILENAKKSKKAHELEVVMLIHGFQLLCIALGFIIHLLIVNYA